MSNVFTLLGSSRHHHLNSEHKKLNGYVFVSIVLITVVNVMFVTWKLICVYCAFFHSELKYVIKTALSPTVFVWHFFLNCNFKDDPFLSRYQYVLNIAETRYYVLKIVWAWKLNHNKDRRHESPITDSQTVQAQICTDTSGHETYSKLCLRNTAPLVAYQTSLW